MEHSKLPSIETFTGINNVEAVLLSEQPLSAITFDDLVQHEAFQAHDWPILAGDFIVELSEGTTKVPIVVEGVLVGFYLTKVMPDGIKREVINIDHHDKDDSRGHQTITATMQAIVFLLKYQNSGIFPTPYDTNQLFVAVSHLDCDSTSFLTLMMGLVPQNEWALLGEATIIADHAGTPHLIADVAQGVSSKMESAVVKKSRGENLSKLSIKGKSIKTAVDCLLEAKAAQVYNDETLLSPIAKEALAFRREERNDIIQILQTIDDEGNLYNPSNGELFGQLQNLGNNITYIKVFEKKIPTELLASVLPEASVIIEASPHRKALGWEVSLRAGGAFPYAGNLNNLRVAELFHIVGRWNASANGRYFKGISNPDSVALYIATHYHEISATGIERDAIFRDALNKYFEPKRLTDVEREAYAQNYALILTNSSIGKEFGCTFTFLEQGGDSLIFLMNGNIDFENICLKLSLSLMRDTVYQIASHGQLALDRLHTTLEQNIRREDLRFTRLSTYFSTSEGGVVDSQRLIRSVPFDDSVMNLAFQVMPYGIFSRDFLLQERETVITLQQYSPQHQKRQLISGQTNSIDRIVTFGCQRPERRNDMNEELYTQTNQRYLYLAHSNPLRNDVLQHVFRRENDFATILTLIDTNPKFASVLNNLVMKSLHFSHETGEILDIAGLKNIILFSEHDQWHYGLLDPLFVFMKASHQSAFAQRTRSIAKYSLETPPYSLQAARSMITRMNSVGIQNVYKTYADLGEAIFQLSMILNYVRFINAIADKLHIPKELWLDIIPQELKASQESPFPFRELISRLLDR